MWFLFKCSHLWCEPQHHSICNSLRLEVRNTELDHHTGDFHGILQFQLTLSRLIRLNGSAENQRGGVRVGPWCDFEYLKKSCGGISFPTVQDHWGPVSSAFQLPRDGRIPQVCMGLTTHCQDCTVPPNLLLFSSFRWFSQKVYSPT